MTDNISNVFEDEGVDIPQPIGTNPMGEGVVEDQSSLKEEMRPMPRPTISPVSDTSEIGNIWDDEGYDRPVDDINEEGRLYSEKDIMSNPLKMAGIRAYMVDRLGKQWEQRDDKEVFDTFMSRMRFMNTNEIRTLSEARYIQKADDEKKNIAATAYNIYDEIAPFWSSGAGIDAAWDYTKAIITSPSTYIGAGVGKIAAGLGTQAGKAAILAAARQAARTGGTEAAKAVLVGAAKTRLAKEVGVATAIDTGISVGTEKVNQDILMDVGLQDEYDMNSLAIAAASGLIGGGVAYIPEARRGALGFDPNQLKRLTDANAKSILSGSAKKLTVKNTPDDPEYARYMASLWRRMLVSHPATTAVNVQGWGIAHFARSMAELVDGGALGTAGMIGKTMNASWSPQALKESKDLVANVNFKLKMLMDPYGSRQAFDALLSRAPEKAQEAILAEAFGGVARNNMADKFGMHKAPDVIKSGVRGAEKVADAAAAVSLIKVQDIYTKTFSALGELDKLARLRLNMGLEDVVNNNQWAQITDDMWYDALKVMTTDTFSRDYTKGRGVLNQMAALVEKASDTPYIGFLFPFGRFMNNTIAYTYQYSPLAFVGIAADMAKSGKPLRSQGIKALLPSNSDISTDISKAIVGSTALWTAMDYSMKAEEEGFNWYEHEDSTGQVTTQENLAPISTLKLLARMGGHLREGKSIPPELIAELGDNLGPMQWAREVSGNNPFAATLQWLSRDKNPEAEGQWIQLGQEFLAGLSGQVVSGFTRPLDPLNRVVGMKTETDYSIDRRLADGGAEKIALELTKYTDNIFDSIMEEPLGEARRDATRPEGDIYDPNPIGGLLGRKEVPAKNYIDVILGKVDMPSYKFNQRTGSPEADRFMNEQVAPLLNVRSQALLKDETFNKASPSIKRAMVLNMLSSARSVIKARLNDGLIGTSEDRDDEARRVWMATPGAIRDEARRDLNIGKDDKELTKEEIDLLRYYSSTLQEFYKSKSE